MRIDSIDANIVQLFSDEPRIGVLEASRRLGLARATVQSRLDKLVAGGAIASFAPRLAPAEFGYPVSAYVSVRVEQRAGHTQLGDFLAAIPEVTEVHTVSGDFDMLCRVVATSNADLQRVLDRISEHPTPVRTSSSIVLTTHFEQRTLPAFVAAAERGP
ncbi:MAG TPA: Lrp/AsnC family transcriptional regulator [Candidatus Agrococcus pullicola]|uniref:Lrp/AsnC family transcriptional regulator n=1 Tax=Candidatus Agrococcus pullicola TaxID=2838429 RepID=A0A9D1YSV7_9MICO|nr:Lrp/AsnC family transcriptional regulator [Candidatus Agrococcus pullicola]